MMKISSGHAVLLGLTLAISISPAVADEPRARTFTYDARAGQWTELPPPPPGTAAGGLFVAEQQIVAGDSAGALAELRRWKSTYGEDHELYPRWLILRARALMARKNFDKAHEVLQQYLSQFGGMASTPEALRLEFIIAETYLTGVKRRFLGIPLVSGEEVAYEILDSISANYPESPEAPLAIKTKADYLFEKGEFTLAEIEYARLLRDYPLSRYDRFALRRAADAALASFRGIPYDDAPLVEARERYRDYQGRYPAWADQPGENIDLVLERIDETQASKTLRIGRYYERTRHIASAIFYYREVLRTWPDSAAAVEAEDRMNLLGADAGTGG